MTDHAQDPLPGAEDMHRERIVKLQYLVRLLLDPSSDEKLISELRRELGL